MKSKKRLFGVSIVTATALVFFFLACERNSAITQNESSSDDSKEIVSAVFIYNSQACDCEKNRNEEASALMKSVLKDAPEPKPIERIDKAAQEDKYEGYAAKAKMSFLPVLLGLDENGRIVKKIEGFFDESDVMEILL